MVGGLGVDDCQITRSREVFHFSGQGLSGRSHCWPISPVDSSVCELFLCHCCASLLSVSYGGGLEEAAHSPAPEARPSGEKTRRACRGDVCDRHAAPKYQSKSDDVSEASSMKGVVAIRHRRDLLPLHMTLVEDLKKNKCSGPPLPFIVLLSLKGRLEVQKFFIVL